VGKEMIEIFFWYWVIGFAVIYGIFAREAISAIKEHNLGLLQIVFVVFFTSLLWLPGLTWALFKE
jgi:hypothetical protein